MPENRYDIDPELLVEFLDESDDLFDTANDLFVSLESNPHDTGALDAITQTVHSLKGNSTFFNLMKVKSLAHRMEELMNTVREGRLSYNGEVSDILSKGIELLKNMMSRVRKGEDEVSDISELEELNRRIEQIATGETKTDLPRLCTELLSEADVFGRILKSADTKVQQSWPKIFEMIRQLSFLSKGGTALADGGNPSDSPRSYRNQPICVLLEELRLTLAGTNDLTPDLLPDIMGKIEQIQQCSRQEGREAVAAAVAWLQKFLDANITLVPKLLQDLFLCWLSVVQKSVSGELPVDGADKYSLVSILQDEFEKLLKQTFGDPYQLQKILGKPAYHIGFVAKVPELDLSDGSDIIMEFITEAKDHLEHAEASLLILEKDHGSPGEVDKVFRALHTIKGVSSFLNLDNIRDFSHDTETMMDRVRLGDIKLNADRISVVFGALDALRKLLDLLKEQVLNNGVLSSPYFDVLPALKKVWAVIDGQDSPEPLAAAIPRLGEILVDKSVISNNDLNRALQQQEQATVNKKLGEILVEMGAATLSQIQRGLRDQKIANLGEFVKISVKKLDDLVDSMGELVTTGAQVVRHPEIVETRDSRLRKDVEQLERTIRGIQDISMSVRLVPIRPVFQKVVRVARDLSLKEGKKIDIQVSGDETEIDRSMTEVLQDPLMHMIRNSVDHGIEPAEVRLAKQKPPRGVISLHAYHKGDNVVIDMKDDGAGLDKEKILQRAIERGLAKQDEALSDDKIYHFIFEPGFSTAETVTDVSGRGVGMDVVKRNVERLHGRVDITTELGRGTTFSIRLPLTLAVIDGVIARIGTRNFILPMFSVRELIRPRREDITEVAGLGEIIMVHGNNCPVVRLDRYVGSAYAHESAHELMGCVVSSEIGMLCLLFDELVGQQQVVIKSLGKYLRNLRGVVGATILGDGRVGLILDINDVASWVKSGC